MNETQNSSTKKYYYECFITQDGITAGDGSTCIYVSYSFDDPIEIKSEGQVFKLKYEGSDQGYEIYGTQFPGRKYWVNDQYVLEAIYVMGIQTSVTKWNSQKGVVSGNFNSGNNMNPNMGSGGMNGGYNGNNNRSSEYTCPTCHGTGRCTSCAGRGEWRGNDGRLYDCRMCHGSGVCYGCHGKRTIR